MGAYCFQASNKQAFCLSGKETLSHPSRLIAVNTTLRNDLGKSYEGLGFLAYSEKKCAKVLRAYDTLPVLPRTNLCFLQDRRTNVIKLPPSGFMASLRNGSIPRAQCPSLLPGLAFIHSSS